jgi:hypothetical protein
MSSFEEEFPGLMGGFSSSFRPFDLVQKDWIRESCLDKQRVREAIRKYKSGYPEEFEMAVALLEKLGLEDE